MKCLILAVSVALVGAAAAWAESPDPTTLRFRGEVPPPPQVSVSAGDVSATPEMWFYEQQLRRHDDPKQAVRRKAESRADQRQRRLAALKWFGYSNSRPAAGTDPYNGAASPTWTSNNLWEPYHWTGSGPSWIALERAGY